MPAARPTTAPAQHSRWRLFEGTEAVTRDTMCLLAWWSRDQDDAEDDDDDDDDDDGDGDGDGD
eukprot:2786-Pyramimonas_sp.AAC.1